MIRRPMTAAMTAGGRLFHDRICVLSVGGFIYEGSLSLLCLVKVGYSVFIGNGAFDDRAHGLPRAK